VESAQFRTRRQPEFTQGIEARPAAVKVKRLIGGALSRSQFQLCQQTSAQTSSRFGIISAAATAFFSAAENFTTITAYDWGETCKLLLVL